MGLRGPYGRHRVYRRPNERFAPGTVVETRGFQGGSIMFWGGISLRARTDLVFFDRVGINAQIYLQECIEPQVVPFAPVIGDGFLLMQDNSRPHVARCVIQYLNNARINRLPWPARNPDLNPIEHVWDNLKRRVRARVPVPNTMQELRTALQEEWHNIPQDCIENPFNSLPNRMREVIRFRGGNTHY